MNISHRFLFVALTSVLIGMATLAGITRLKTHIGVQPSRFILTRSQKKSSAKLVDLPIEVLIEILLLLEWKDILHIRQTCHRLRDASLARPVWLSLVQWYSATVQPPPFFPEKPLVLYTDRELERLVLRWQSGRIGYTRPQPKQRDIGMPESHPQCPYLVEGGRWFLFGSDNGSIKYYDLDVPTETSELKAVTLIPTFFDDDDRAVVMLSVEMDLEAEYLTFNLGIMTHRLPDLEHDPDYPNPPRYARWIQVCRVTPDWDGNGQVKGLRAEQLACFQEEYNCGCDSFTLGGRYVAYSIYSYLLSPTVGDGESIAIVDWTSADPTSMTYPRRLLWRRRARWLALLPDDRLLCDYSSHFLLFDLNDAAVTTLPATQLDQPPAQPPVASFRMYVRAISRPYVVHDSIRFSALTDEGVDGIIIPPSQGVSHTVDCLNLFSDVTHVSHGCLNYDRSLICYPDCAVLQYAWPGEDSSSLVSQKTAVQAPYSPYILFDSSTCRIVSRPKMSEISVVDLSFV